MIPFTVGDDITVTSPGGVGGFLDMEAVIDFNALLSNSTNLGIDFGLDFLVGEFGLRLPILGSRSIGPLFRDHIDVADTSFEVFDKDFTLDCFNQQTASFRAQVVPEPSTLVLVSLALLLLPYYNWRRWRQTAVRNWSRDQALDMQKRIDSLDAY